MCASTMARPLIVCTCADALAIKVDAIIQGRVNGHKSLSGFGLRWH